MRLFLIGPSGGGKSFRAKEISAELNIDYIECDTGHHPAPMKDGPLRGPITRVEVRLFLENCDEDLRTDDRNYILDVPRPGYVVDNIPFDPSWDEFNSWSIENKPDVFCCVPENEIEWMLRKSQGGHELTHEIWLYFWTKILPMLKVPFNYIASPGGQIISREDAMKRIGMAGLIREQMKGYDENYQCIKEIGHVGYSGTEESWNRISGLADWSSCSVVDCGSFHGYMLFRAGDSGCTKKRIGLDFLNPALETAKLVNLMRRDSVEFLSWRAGEPIPEADVTLCLNALHHFPDNSHPLGTHCPVTCSVEKFFDSIKSPIVIFEAYTSYETYMRENWKTVERYPSARENRAIYRCL